MSHENKNEVFEYTYSAAQQEEVKKIREKYIHAPNSGRPYGNPPPSGCRYHQKRNGYFFDFRYLRHTDFRYRHVLLSCLEFVPFGRICRRHRHCMSVGSLSCLRTHYKKGTGPRSSRNPSINRGTDEIREFKHLNSLRIFI